MASSLYNDPMSNEKWRDLDQLILSELKTIKEELVNARVDIGGLKVKAGVWGMAGGTATVLITIAIFVIKQLFQPG